jgi:hypothetical protein
MILTHVIQTPIYTIAAPTDHTELSRLLAAGIVNDQFKTLLLNDPESALANGYLSESFQLTVEERALLISIRAGTLTELAKQLSGALVSNRVLIG